MSIYYVLTVCHGCCLFGCLQTAIIELAIKRRHRITDSAFDELCKWHYASRPQTEDNYYPRSLWLMKKLAGVEDVRKIQVRVQTWLCASQCLT